MSKVKLAVMLILVFVIGGLSGSLVTGMQVRKKMEVFRKGGPMPFKHFFMGKMGRNLELTETQRKEIDGIVLQMQTDINQLREQHQPRMTEIIEQYTSQINNKLDPRQKEQMQNMLNNMQNRRKGKHHRGKHMRGRGYGKSGSAPKSFRQLRKLCSDPQISDEQRQHINRILEESIQKIREEVKPK